MPEADALPRAQNIFQLDLDRLDAHGVSLDSFPASLAVDNSQLEEILSTMHLIRCMELRLQELFEGGAVRGFCHLTTGQELLCSILKTILSDNLLISSYRCHGPAIASGCSPFEIISENLGLRSGSSRGKGGSMHLFGRNFYGGHGIVGAQVPLGCGLAFSLKYAAVNKLAADSSSNRPSVPAPWTACHTARVCFCLYGDGASNQGQIYESFNLARIYSLPIVFICENNKYSRNTLTTNVSPDDNYHRRAYGIPGIRLDDSDPVLLLAALQFCSAHSRTSGPIILQVDTNKTCDHSTIEVSRAHRADPEYNTMAILEALVSRHCGPETVQAVRGRASSLIEDALNSINYDDKPGEEELYADM